jgi:hypothetical protein
MAFRLVVPIPGLPQYANRDDSAFAASVQIGRGSR